MNMDWNELHKVVFMEALEEIRANLPADGVRRVNVTALSRQIASRVCIRLHRLQQQLHDYKTEEDGDEEDQEPPAAFHVPD